MTRWHRFEETEHEYNHQLDEREAEKQTLREILGRVKWHISDIEGDASTCDVCWYDLDSDEHRQICGVTYTVKHSDQP